MSNNISILSQGVRIKRKQCLSSQDCWFNRRLWWVGQYQSDTLKIQADLVCVWVKEDRKLSNRITKWTKIILYVTLSALMLRRSWLNNYWSLQLQVIIWRVVGRLVVTCSWRRLRNCCIRFDSRKLKSSTGPVCGSKLCETPCKRVVTVFTVLLLLLYNQSVCSVITHHSFAHQQNNSTLLMWRCLQMVSSANGMVSPSNTWKNQVRKWESAGIQVRTNPCVRQPPLVAIS